MLDELVDGERSITYGVVKPGDNPVDGVLLIRGGDIYGGRIDVSALRRIAPDLSQQYRRTVLQGGELIVSLVGNPGEVAIVPNSLRGANLARQVGLVPLRPEIESKYVMYYLMSPWGRAAFGAEIKGSVQRVINLADLRRIRVPMPPHSKQRRIASILSTYDDLIENNVRRIAILEEMARRIYEEWFVRFRFPGHEGLRVVESELGLVPEGWRHRSLAWFGDVKTGKTPSKANPNFYGGDVPFLKTPDMHGNMFILVTGESLSAQGAASQRNKTLPVGTLCVSCIGTIGVVSITTEPCQTNQQINSLVPMEKAALEFLFFRLKDARKILENLGATGATMGNVNKSKFEALSILTPPHDLLAKFHEQAAQMFALIEILDRKNRTLRTTRDLLLPKLISCELNVSLALELEDHAA